VIAATSVITRVMEESATRNKRVCNNLEGIRTSDCYLNKHRMSVYL
jgi:hypothetical protein